MKAFCDLVNEMLPTLDCGPRVIGEDWVGIIIHHTGIANNDPKKISESLWRSLNKNIAKFIQQQDETSAHFQIGRFGELTQFVDPHFDRAFHAGKSEWYHPTKRALVQNWNKYSIGIELLGDGNLGPYSDEQYDTLVSLVKEILLRFPTIDPRCITGHENIAPGRKTDPGLYFDWSRFFQRVYEQS